MIGTMLQGRVFPRFPALSRAFSACSPQRIERHKLVVTPARVLPNLLHLRDASRAPTVGRLVGGLDGLDGRV